MRLLLERGGLEAIFLVIRAKRIGIAQCLDYNSCRHNNTFSDKVKSKSRMEQPTISQENGYNEEENMVSDEREIPSGDTCVHLDDRDLSVDEQWFLQKEYTRRHRGCSKKKSEDEELAARWDKHKQEVAMHDRRSFDQNGDQQRWDLRKRMRENQRHMKRVNKIWNHRDRLEKYGTVFEFGYEVDMECSRDIEKILEKYDDWLTSLTLPTDYERFLDFVRKFFKDKPHRFLLFALLASHRQKKARMFCMVQSGSMTKKKFEHYMTEKQSWELIPYAIIAAMAVMLWVIIQKSNNAEAAIAQIAQRTEQGVIAAIQPVIHDAQQAATNINMAAGNINITTGQAGQDLLKVANLVGDIAATCQAVWNWCKDIINYLKGLVTGAHPIGSKIFYGILTCVGVLMGIELARSMFKKDFKVVRSYILAQAEFEDTPEYEKQAGGEGDKRWSHPLMYCFESMRVWFVKTPQADFWQFADKLPKLVNLAKAIGWIMDHIMDVYHWFVEAITGEAQGRTRFERDVMDFERRATLLKIEMDKGVVETWHSLETRTEYEWLKMERQRLEGQAIRKKETMRNHIATTWTYGKSSLTHVEQRIRFADMTAKPRAVPVWVYIYGSPGVRKSGILKKLMAAIYRYVQKYSEIIDKTGTFGEKDFYTMIQSDKHFDGYGNQFFMIIDDIFQSTKIEDRNNVAKVLIEMISPHACPLLVATPEQKSRMFFTSRCMISTSNMIDFRKANLGLESYQALEGRRTVVVEKLAGDKDEFVLHSSNVYTTENNVVKTHLTMDELVQIIGEAIIEQDAKIEREFDSHVPERFTGKFQSTRLSLGTTPTSSVASSSGSDDSDNVIVLEDMKDEDFEDDKEKESGEGPSDVDTLIRDKGKERVREGDLPGERQVRQMLRAPPVQTPLWRRGLKKVSDWWQEDIEAENQVLKMLKTRYSVYENSEDALDYFDAVFPAEMTRTKRDWLDEKILMWMYGPTAFSTKYCQTPRAFMPRMSARYIESIREIWGYAGLTLDQPTICSFFHTCWQQYALGGQMRKHFAKAFMDHNMASPNYWTVQNVIRAHTEVTQRMTIIGEILMWAAGISFAVIVARRFLKMIMPAKAYKHKEKQAGYDSSPKREGEKFRRVSRAQKKARQNERIRRVFGGEEKESGVSDCYRTIAQNYDVVEVRIAPVRMIGEEVMKYKPISHSWCLFIAGRLALVPAHTLVAQADNPGERYFSFSHHINSCIHKDELRVIAELGGDILIVEIPKTFPERRNILNLFADGDIGHMRPVHVRPHRGSLVCEINPVRSWQNVIQVVNPSDGDEYPPIEADLEFTGVSTELGLCGTVYCDNATGKIVAMHIGGAPSYNIAFGVTVFKQDLEQYVFDAKPIQVIDPLPDSRKECQVVHGVLTEGVVSERAAVWMPTETSLKKSTFRYNTFPVPETKNAPAMLAPEGDISPKKLAVERFDKQGIYNAPPPDLAHTDDFLGKHFDRQAAGRMKTIWIACYGDGKTQKGLDMNTSAGYFYKRMGLTKKKLLYDEDGNQRIHPLLMWDILNWFEKAREGKLIPGVFEETLKDEIRDEARVKAGKTRLFAAGDLRTMIISKMVLGCFVEECERDPINSPCALGINVHSRDWGLIWSKLKGLDEEEREAGAGDFATYDFSHKNNILQAFIRMIQEFHEEPELVFYAVMANFDPARHVLGRIVFRRPWGTSSGCYLTSIYNTFVNWYIHKQCWLSLYDEDEWRKFFFGKFYGDDSVYSVPKAYNKFNMEYLQKWFWENYHMDYTSPNKEAARYLPFEEITFLKRHFVPGPLGIMAPLAKDSIADMIKWTEKPGDIEVMDSVLQSMEIEVFHHGKDLYDRCHKWAVKESNRLNINFRLMSYEAMKEKKASDYAR